MPDTTPLVLVSPRKVEIAGAARWTVIPAWRRGLIAGGLLFAGLVAAVPAIAIPPHGVVSAAVFGVAALFAYATWGRAELVDEVVFTCACGAEARIEGVGAWSDDTWVRCPACQGPWRVGPRT